MMTDDKTYTVRLVPLEEWKAEQAWKENEAELRKWYEQIERVARALQLRDFEYNIEDADQTWDNALDGDAYREGYRDDARKILTALNAQSLPQGLQAISERTVYEPYPGAFDQILGPDEEAAASATETRQGRDRRALSRSDDGATRPAGGGRSDDGAALR